MTTMLWTWIDPLCLMVLVHGEAQPTDGEWDDYVAALYATNGRLCRVLVFSDGGGPNARQRQKLHDQHGLSIQTAVVTHSVIPRGIVTALGWFYKIRAFPPVELIDAIEYLTIPRGDWLMVQKNVAELRIRLLDSGPSRGPFEMSETLGKLEELVTDRLPKLRERMLAHRGK